MYTTTFCNALAGPVTTLSFTGRAPILPHSGCRDISITAGLETVPVKVTLPSIIPSSAAEAATAAAHKNAMAVTLFVGRGMAHSFTLQEPGYENRLGTAGIVCNAIGSTKICVWHIGLSDKTLGSAAKVSPGVII